MNQRESCASMDADADASAGRAIKSGPMFCSAVRTGNHPFVGLGTCRRCDSRVLTDSDSCRSSHSGKEKGQCKGDRGSEQDDFDAHVLGLHENLPETRQVMDARFGGKVGTEETAPGMPFPMKANYPLSFLNERTSTARTRNGTVLLGGDKVEISSRSADFPIEPAAMTVRELGCRCGSLDRT